MRLIVTILAVTSLFCFLHLSNTACAGGDDDTKEEVLRLFSELSMDEKITLSNEVQLAITATTMDIPEYADDVMADVFHHLSSLSVIERMKFFNTIQIKIIEQLLEIPDDVQQKYPGHLAKLCPRRLILRNKSPYREGGAYFSFTENGNDYSKSPQLECSYNITKAYLKDKNGEISIRFLTGFHGGQGGFLLPVDNKDIDTITIDDVPEDFLLNIENIRTIQQQVHRNRDIQKSFELNNIANQSFLIRTYERYKFDLIVAFQVLEATRNTVLIKWNIIKEYPVEKDPRKR